MSPRWTVPRRDGARAADARRRRERAGGGARRSRGSEVRAVFVCDDDGRLARRRDAEDARARGRRGRAAIRARRELGEIAEPPLLHARRRPGARGGLPLARGAGSRARAGRRGAAASSASSRAPSCSAAWPRTSRRTRTRRPLVLAAGVGAGRRRALLRFRQLGGGERGAVEDVALARLDRRRGRSRRGSRRGSPRPRRSPGRAPGRGRISRRSSSGSAASRVELLVDAPSRVRTWPWTRSRSYSSRPRSSAASVVTVPGDADRALRRRRLREAARAHVRDARVDVLAVAAR